MTDSLVASRQLLNKNAWIFSMLWLLTFILYIPAAKAGWVIDAVGFLSGLQHDGFWDFINRTHSEDQSFYQLFTLHYYVFYKIWGLNLWLWSLLYITVQSLNAYLLFLLCKTVFSDTGVKNGSVLALVAAFLFTINPHISEVVICKAYYHYLQSFFFILLIMLWVIRYQHTAGPKYIWFAAIIFFLCAFTLEIFYLIPFFVLSIALYYRFALGFSRPLLKKTILWFVIPQVLMLCIYFVALYTTFKYLKPHKIALTSSVIDYLSKPPKYIFHIVCLGRFFPVPAKEKIYAFCESGIFLLVFYSLAASIFLYSVTHLKKLTFGSKALSLFGLWAALTIAFVVPLSFPGSALLVFYDRYTYFADGFVYAFLALFIGQMVSRCIGIALLCLYSVVNLYFTVRLNLYWKQSAYINNRLLQDLPAPGNKTVILLNIPENMNGVPMIGAQPDGEYKSMREIFVDKSVPNKIYDAASYNMNTMDNGAHVMVINDSVIHVTLNQWGTWWWYEGHGAKSYETTDYKLNLVDQGHWYELTLKHPADEYLLLYEVGSAWKTVDMSKKGQDQY